jgi:hypothetical protein
MFGLAACLPFDNELLFSVGVRCCAAAIAHHTLRQNGELDVANQRYTTPGYGSRP